MCFLKYPFVSNSHSCHGAAQGGIWEKYLGVSLIVKRAIFSATSVCAFKAVDMTHLCRKFCFCFYGPLWICQVSACGSGVPACVMEEPSESLWSLNCYLLWKVFPCFCDRHGFLLWNTCMCQWSSRTYQEPWYPAVVWEHCLAMELSVHSGMTLGEPCRKRMLSHTGKLAALVHPLCSLACREFNNNTETFKIF